MHGGAQVEDSDDSSSESSDNHVDAKFGFYVTENRVEFFFSFIISSLRCGACRCIEYALIYSAQ